MISDVNVAVLLARFAFVVALLSGFGASVFSAWIGQPTRHRAKLAQSSLAAACLLLPVWLLAQAADMAAAPSLYQALAITPKVLRHTQFGHLAAAQFLALALATIALASPVRGRRRLAAALAGLAVALQAGHGHAWSMDRQLSPLVLASVAHLLAAGGWLGGLVPLLLAVRAAPPTPAATSQLLAVARRYSILGKACVWGIALSSSLQAWRLIGSIPAAFTTPYGWVALAKAALFAVLLGVAVLNRFFLVPALRHPNPQLTKPRLITSLASQSCLGIAVLLAATLLSSLAPAMPSLR